MKKYLLALIIGFAFMDLKAQKKDTLTVWISPAGINTHGMVDAYGIFNHGDSTRPLSYIDRNKQPLPKTWVINEWMPRGWQRKNFK